MSKRRSLGLLTALTVVVIAVFGWLAYRQTTSPFKGYLEPEKFVTVNRGFSVSQIGAELQKAGVIRSGRLFGWYVRLRHPTASLKAGEYRFDRPLDLQQVVEKLIRGDIFFQRVTIPEGYCAEDIAKAFVSHGIGKLAGFREATRDISLIAKVDPQAQDLEGYLFPDTFLLARNTTEKEVVERMVQGFLRAWTPERQQRARALNMTPREVVTLASIIEKETGQPIERPLVSAVFHNRLKQNIKLGSDPTVVYGVKLVKEYDGVIHKSDLQLDSPYNTYLYAGLPPGPIASPGLASLDAALNPAEVDYLYFVSRNDGSHFFSVQYRDHMRAVQKYQR